MNEEIKKLIADRKERLNRFSANSVIRKMKSIFSSGFPFIDPVDTPKEVSDIERAKEDNDESDKESLSKFNMIFVSGLAEIADGWYRNDQGEVLIF